MSSHYPPKGKPKNTTLYSLLKASITDQSGSASYWVRAILFFLENPIKGEQVNPQQYAAAQKVIKLLMEANLDLDLDLRALLNTKRPNCLKNFPHWENSKESIPHLKRNSNPQNHLYRPNGIKAK